MPIAFVIWVIAVLLAHPSTDARPSTSLGATLSLSKGRGPLSSAEGQQPPAASPASNSLDYEFFKTKIQPIFLAKRPGHARCYACHSQGTPLRLQELSPGSTNWNEEQSQKNFEAVRRMVNPNDPLKSMLLIHPLATDAGGDLFHNGGKHWTSQNEPEWQTLLAWVKGKR